MKADPPQRSSRRPSKHGKSSNLSVRNLQRRHAIDASKLRSFLEKVAIASGAAERSATVALVSDERMRSLNLEFRGYDEPTDVLSFGNGEEGDYLGDIVISVETARRQASRRGSSLRREVEVLTLHGFLHLLGYDHEADEGEMRRLEYRLRKKLGITRGSGERKR